MLDSNQVEYDRLRKEEAAFAKEIERKKKAAAAARRWRAPKPVVTNDTELTLAIFEADNLASKADDLVKQHAGQSEVAEVRRQYIAAVAEVRKLREEAKQEKKGTAAASDVPDYSQPAAGTSHRRLDLFTERLNALRISRISGRKSRKSEGAPRKSFFSRLVTRKSTTVRQSSDSRDSWNASSARMSEQQLGGGP